MGNAFLYGGAGSGNLRFKVMPYATVESLLASAAAENTIGIVTTNKMTSWVVDSTVPATPSEGMVWISTGKASRIIINILKKNVIYIYPQVVKQYVSGAWVILDSFCHQNKTWTSLWFGQLYTPGNEWTEVTGGWTSVGKKSYSGSGAKAKAPTITRTVSAITAEVSGAGVFYPVNKIDLTDFDTLTFRGEFTRGGSAGRNLMAACWKDFGTYYDEGAGAPVANADLPESTGTEIAVDISALTGEHIVGLGMTDSKVAITEVILSASNSAEAKAAAYDILTGGIT